MYERECYGGGFDLVVTVVLPPCGMHTPSICVQCKRSAASNQERACACVNVCGVERERTIG